MLVSTNTAETVWRAPRRRLKRPADGGVRWGTGVAGVGEVGQQHEPTTTEARSAEANRSIPDRLKMPISRRVGFTARPGRSTRSGVSRPRRGSRFRRKAESRCRAPVLSAFTKVPFVDLAECPGERLLVLGSHGRDVPGLRRAGFQKTCRTALCATEPPLMLTHIPLLKVPAGAVKTPTAICTGPPNRPNGTSTCPSSTVTMPPWDSRTSSSSPGDPRTERRHATTGFAVAVVGARSPRRSPGPWSGFWEFGRCGRRARRPQPRV